MVAMDEAIGVRPSDTYKFIICTLPVGPYYAKPVKLKAEESAKKQPSADQDSQLIELVAPPNAAILGRSPMTLNVRTRYHINILAISRNDSRTVGRIRSTQRALKIWGQPNPMMKRTGASDMAQGAPPRSRIIAGMTASMERKFIPPMKSPPSSDVRT